MFDFVHQLHTVSHNTHCCLLAEHKKRRCPSLDCFWALEKKGDRHIQQLLTILLNWIQRTHRDTYNVCWSVELSSSATAAETFTHFRAFILGGVDIGQITFGVPAYGNRTVALQLLLNIFLRNSKQ